MEIHSRWTTTAAGKQQPGGKVPQPPGNHSRLKNRSRRKATADGKVLQPPGNHNRLNHNRWNTTADGKPVTTAAGKPQPMRKHSRWKITTAGKPQPLKNHSRWKTTARWKSCTAARKPQLGGQPQPTENHSRLDATETITRPTGLWLFTVTV